MSCADTGPLGEPLIDPIVDYSHEEGGISVIGGYVYRGSRSPGLVGQYVFGDFSAAFSVPSGRLYFLVEPNPGEFEIREFRIGPDDIPYGRFLKGFGEDEDGEVYVLGSTALAPTGDTGIVERLVVPPTPALDIKPGSCPNPLNRKGRGRLQVALLGTENFDVADVDLSTLTLTRTSPIQVFGASVDGDQANAGLGTGSTGTGQAFMTLDRDTNEFTMDLTFGGLLGTQTVQHVHGPAAPNANAGVMFGIPGPGSFQGFSITLTDAQKRVIQDGLAYINIHSTRNPGGEIRGQIVPAAGVEPLKVRIEDVGTPFGGELCDCSTAGGDGIPDLVLKFDNREVVPTLGIDRLSIGEFATLSVNGNLRPSDGSGVSTFRFGMDALQELPLTGSPGTGSCTVILNELSGSVSVSCAYEGLVGNTFAAHIHGPAQPGENAPVIVPLTATGAMSGTITGGGTLSPSLAQALLDGLTYVNLHTDAHPPGEIRGQIAGGEPFSASDCVRVVGRPPKGNRKFFLIE